MLNREICCKCINSALPGVIDNTYDDIWPCPAKYDKGWIDSWHITGKIHIADIPPEGCHHMLEQAVEAARINDVK